MKVQTIGTKGKFGYFCITLIVVSCLLFELISTYWLSSQIEQSNRKIMLNYANQTASRLKDTFNKIDASLEEIKEDLAENQAADLETCLQALQKYNRIWETEVSGVILEDGRSLLSDGRYMAFENEIRLNDVMAYSDQLNLTYQTIDKSEFLVFAKPFQVQMGSEAVTGIFSTLSLKELASMLGEYGYSHSSFLALVRQDGNNIYKQGEAEGLKTNCFEDLSALQIHKGDSVAQMKNRMKVSMDGTLIYTKEGQELYLAYVPLNVNYWYLLIGTRTEAIDYTALSRLYYTTSGVLAAAVIVMGLFGVLYLILRNREISARNEELKRMMELANQANAAKRDFLAKVTHEIRTPLNGVMGMITLAGKHSGEMQPCKEYLDKAMISAEYLLGLIDDVLNMSQIESGKMKLVAEPVDMARLKNELETITQSNAEKKKLTVRIDDSGLKHRCFISDYLRLKQILVNLISNSIKYTEEGGTIEAAISETEEDNRPLVVFSVKDNGAGISDGALERIFDSFEQGDVNNTVPGKGVGLGLSIVKSIVEMMNGRIEVESKVGEGSSFRVYLPLEVCSRETGKNESDGEADLKGISVLLAEDNALNAEIAIELLKDKGACVTLARDGEAAVELFLSSASGTYQVILMDIQMPVKNGIEASMEIRCSEHEEGRDIPIIAMTANAFEEQKEEMIRAGMTDFLYKPIDIDKVCMCIRKWIRERG